MQLQERSIIPHMFTQGVRLRTNILLALTLVVSLFYSVPAQCGTGLDPERSMYVTGPISRGALAPIYQRLDEVLATDSTAPVTIIINSPGGEVISGVALINKVLALKSVGITVNCYVLDMAASMAFQLLTQCTNRYALTNSYLLWHGVRTSIQGPITTLVAQSIAEDLKRMDDVIVRQLENSLSLTSKEIMHHYDRETLWSGSQLEQADRDFLSTKDAYPQVLKLLRMEKLAKSAAPSFSFFGELDGDKGTTFLHSIWRRYEYMLLSNGGMHNE